MAGKIKCHGESLLRIPLVKQMIEDPRFKFIVRSIDSNWHYSKFIPFAINGFNPFFGHCYISFNSALANWLEAPEISARKFNEGDFLVKEVLMAVHDYIHAWTYAQIRNYYPEIGIGMKAITHENIEDFAFCHIVTEAAAVVGLDYWYLSTFNLNDVIPIGTNIENVAVRYRHTDIQEYRRFKRTFNPQEPNFLQQIVEFYCSGEFNGFSPADLSNSPKIQQWLEHELNYSGNQRGYIRLWLGYLSDEPFKENWHRLKQPIQFRKQWQKNLVRRIANLLWKLVNSSQEEGILTTPPISDKWRFRSHKPIDFRFTAFDSTKKLPSPNAYVKSSLSFLKYQKLAGYYFKDFSRNSLNRADSLLRTEDLSGWNSLFKTARRIPEIDIKQPDLFFPQ